MKTSRPRPKPVRTRLSDRYGYDRSWWGAAALGDAPYWVQTRRPLASLAFVLPILAAYELAAARLGDLAGEGARTGVDAWVRQTLAGVGLTDRWLPPLALVLALLAWQALDGRGWRFRPAALLGMAAESLLLAVALIGLSKLLDLGFVRLDDRTLEAVRGGGHPYAPLVGYLGAGVYEEALFRLALIPASFGLLRLLHAPAVVASTLAVTGSALVFSIAHHAGIPGESFTLFAFIFRWLAGVYFAWIFLARGFGIAVGAHAAYDILVGWLGWQF